jgi:hypothetical protein
MRRTLQTTTTTNEKKKFLKSHTRQLKPRNQKYASEKAGKNTFN